jgi:F0F1-type ATP synthase assembly protein I
LRPTGEKKGFSAAFREVAPYLDLGWRLAVSMGVGVLGGLWLDRRLHTTPLFLLTGTFLGAVSGIWTIYKTVYLKNKTKTDEK